MLAHGFSVRSGEDSLPFLTCSSGSTRGADRHGRPLSTAHRRCRPPTTRRSRLPSDSLTRSTPAVRFSSAVTSAITMSSASPICPLTSSHGGGSAYGAVPTSHQNLGSPHASRAWRPAVERGGKGLLWEASMQGAAVIEVALEAQGSAGSRRSCGTGAAQLHELRGEAAERGRGAAPRVPLGLCTCGSAAAEALRCPGTGEQPLAVDPARWSELSSPCSRERRPLELRRRCGRGQRPRGRSREPIP